MRTSAVSLLRNGKLDTLTLWQRNPRLFRTNNEDIVLTGSERVVNGILDVNDVKASVVTLTVSNDTNATHVATTSDHSNDTTIKFDVARDLASSELDLDSVVDFNGWVRVSDTTRAQTVSISVGKV